MTQDEADKIIRHFDLVAEGLRSKIRSVAEGHGMLAEGQKRLELGQQVLTDRVTGLESGQQALVGSVKRLESGQHALVESLNRLETAQQFFTERGNGIAPRLISPSVESLS